MAAQGTDLIAISRGGVNYKLTLADIAALLGAGVPLDVIEVDLGATARRSGSFTIAGTGMTPGAPVQIAKAAGPYTGKGARADEAELDQITATAVVETASLIRVYWQSAGPVRGNFKFSYLIGV